jgi:hypothetical protein
MPMRWATESCSPVVEVLLRERLVEVVLVAQRSNVGWSGALAEHLQDGVAGNQMNEQKNQRDHKPDHGNGENEACEDRSHGLKTRIQLECGVSGVGYRV